VVIFRNALSIALLTAFMSASMFVGISHSQQGDEQEPQAKQPVAASAAKARPPYSTKGKRDPFLPFIKLLEKDNNASQHPSTKLLPPIKKYPVQEFRLVGVMWIGDEPRAMVVDPEKNTYFLVLGDEIGNKNGKIIEIRDNGILVEERSYVEDVFGAVKEKKTKTVLAFNE